jgi:hypothetical protein
LSAHLAIWPCSPLKKWSPDMGHDPQYWAAEGAKHQALLTGSWRVQRRSDDEHHTFGPARAIAQRTIHPEERPKVPHVSV